jgi:hypothetical protein
MRNHWPAFNIADNRLDYARPGRRSRWNSGSRVSNAACARWYWKPANHVVGNLVAPVIRATASDIDISVGLTTAIRLPSL